MFFLNMQNLDFVIKYFLKYAKPRFRYKILFKIYGAGPNFVFEYKLKLSFSPFLTRNFPRISAEMDKNVKFSRSRLRHSRFSILSPTLVHETTCCWRYPPIFETH